MKVGAGPCRQGRCIRAVQVELVVHRLHTVVVILGNRLDHDKDDQQGDQELANDSVGQIPSRMGGAIG
jgi:hypothetical protein